MSVWKEIIKLVNSNFNKTLDVHITEQVNAIKEMMIQAASYGGTLITSSDTTYSTTFTPSISGKYKIICVGKGGDSGTYSSKPHSGGSGGVAVEVAELTKGTSYSVVIGNGTDDTNKTTSFASLCSATSAKYSTAGTATVTNGIAYQGITGATASSTLSANGADVPFFDAKYMSVPIEPFSSYADYANLKYHHGGIGLFGGKQTVDIDTYSSTAYIVTGGGGYGAGGAMIETNNVEVTSSGGDACVYIELVCPS